MALRLCRARRCGRSCAAPPTGRLLLGYFPDCPPSPLPGTRVEAGLRARPRLSRWSVLRTFDFQVTPGLGSEGRPWCLPGTVAPARQERGERRVSASAADLAERRGHGRRDVRLLRAPAHGQVCGRRLAFSCFHDWGVAGARCPGVCGGLGPPPRPWAELLPGVLLGWEGCGPAPQPGSSCAGSSGACVRAAGALCARPPPLTVSAVRGVACSAPSAARGRCLEGQRRPVSAALGGSSCVGWGSGPAAARGGSRGGWAPSHRRLASQSTVLFLVLPGPWTQLTSPPACPGRSQRASVGSCGREACQRSRGGAGGGRTVKGFGSTTQDSRSAGPQVGAGVRVSLRESSPPSLSPARRPVAALVPPWPGCCTCSVQAVRAGGRGAGRVVCGRRLQLGKWGRHPRPRGTGCCGPHSLPIASPQLPSPQLSSASGGRGRAGARELPVQRFRRTVG